MHAVAVAPTVGEEVLVVATVAVALAVGGCPVGVRVGVRVDVSEDVDVRVAVAVAVGVAKRRPLSVQNSPWLLSGAAFIQLGKM